MVVILQSHHEGDEGVNWDLKGFQKVSLLAGWKGTQKTQPNQTHITVFFTPLSLHFFVLIFYLDFTDTSTILNSNFIESHVKTDF